MARIRWHYTDLGFMKAFAELSEADRKDYPGAPLRRQAKKLNALGKAGWGRLRDPVR